MTELNNLYWIEELLPHDIQSLPKHGGIAYYLDMNLVLILVEKPESTYEHKGVTYPFKLWNGCIFPIEYKKQSAFFLKYSFLENHPANKDWLYIPAESENFEQEVRLMMREISKRNPLLGIPMKIKEPLAKKSTTAKAKKKAGKITKGDKKRENKFLLGVLNQNKKPTSET
ncbi:hypothetical protein [Bdellovibrio svalbardensis]|uniref:DUF1801 domain-containing protein n=1 Tax=Bdellovibrio svalbardensis TaxID=2972972 RepID=A0ABT6DKJ4_9BACT|nr:hypothetical protein [Bdellovibrio svalbardensis]MDG0817037.1 hypothetical protein [Bdellovibrio svalbardensis]